MQKSLKSPEYARLVAMLVAVRHAAGVRQQKLAEKLDKPQSFVAKYEGGAPFDIEQVQRVVIARGRLSIGLSGSKKDDSRREIRIPWSNETSNSAVVIDRDNTSEGLRNEGLIQAIVRAHAWVRRLADGTHESVEELAEANGIHPKVVRQALRLAYLSPEIASAAIEGRQSSTLTLARIPKMLPLPWAKQNRLLTPST
jgi:site-specific DNA recombinase